MVCLSPDSVTRKVTPVVDSGQLLGEEEYKREEDEFRPDNISLVHGYDPIGQKRYQLALRFGTCMCDPYCTTVTTCTIITVTNHTHNSNLPNSLTVTRSIALQ